MKENRVLLILVISTFFSFIFAFSITPYSVTGLGYYRGAFAFPSDNASMALNQSIDIDNESSSNNTPGIAIESNQSSAVLKVNVSVNNVGGGIAQASDFYVTIKKGIFPAYNEAHPYSFGGSTKGTISVIIPGSYTLEVSDVVNDVPYHLGFSGNCVGEGLNLAKLVIKPGDRAVCTITATYPNF